MSDIFDTPVDGTLDATGLNCPMDKVMPAVTINANKAPRACQR